MRVVRSSVALLALAVAMMWMAVNLRFNFTRSLPVGIYRVVERGTVQRGSIVLACLPAHVSHVALEREYVWRGACPGGVSPIGKRVLAASGDIVTLNEGGFFVNGRQEPNTEPINVDSRGRPMLHYRFGQYVVRETELWLYSPHHARSYDSRYFGPIPTASVRSRIVPVWTF